jgi:hypothetical protein
MLGPPVREAAWRLLCAQPLLAAPSAATAVKAVGGGGRRRCRPRDLELLDAVASRVRRLRGCRRVEEEWAARICRQPAAGSVQPSKLALSTCGSRSQLAARAWWPCSSRSTRLGGSGAIGRAPACELGQARAGQAQRGGQAPAPGVGVAGRQQSVTATGAPQRRLRGDRGVCGRAL